MLLAFQETEQEDLNWGNELGGRSLAEFSIMLRFLKQLARCQQGSGISLRKPQRRLARVWSRRESLSGLTSIRHNIILWWNISAIDGVTRVKLNFYCTEVTGHFIGWGGSGSLKWGRASQSIIRQKRRKDIIEVLVETRGYGVTEIKRVHILK